MAACSQPRLLPGPLRLHDIRDTERFVRVLLDARLAGWSAHLQASEYEDALTYLLDRAWELSGLDARGARRRVWRLRVLYDPGDLEDVLEGGEEGELLGPFLSEAAAVAAGQGLDVEIVEGAPTGAYDPAHGLSFSTYARRILSARLVDWYRLTFGDARYTRRLQTVSLDALVERWEHDGAGGADDYLEHRGPQEALLDELNRHTLSDPLEEVLTRVALAR